MKKILIAIGIVVGLAKLGYDYSTRHQGAKMASQRDEAKIQELMADINRGLPFTYDNFVRLERAEYADKVLRYHATMVNKNILSDDRKDQMRQAARKLYCGNKGLTQNGIAAEWVFTTPPRSLNDVRPEVWTLAMDAKQCG